MSKRRMVVRAANPAYAKAMQGIRRSNAAGTHDPRPNRRRSRGDVLRAAVRESYA